MLRFSQLVLALFLPLLAACSAAAPALPPTATPSPAPTATVPAPTSTPAPSPTPTPTATQVPPTLTPTAVPRTASAYKIAVDLAYEQKTAAVQMQVDYTNRADAPLNSLRLVIPPLAYPGAFSLRSLEWTSGEAVKNTAWQENSLEIPLNPALQPGERISLSIAYDLAFPSSAAITGERPVPFAYTARQVNLVDWYPFIPPYSGGEWLVRPTSFYGESLVFEQADFEVTLRLGESAQSLVVAASAPAEAQNGELRYRMEGARSFAISVSPDYQVAKQVVGGIEVLSYYFPAHALAGEAAPQIMAEAVELFQELFGPYPHASMSLVEAEFLDGMEYDGLFFVSRGMYNLYTGTPGEYFHALTVHETSHQWWFASIGNDQAMEPWLDEAFSTYSELLYYERFYPEAVQWWWDVRINYYRPSGWVDSSVYDHLGQPENYYRYRNAVYFNGAVFLSELRRTVGDEAFFAALKDYAQAYTGKIATGKDFFAAVKNRSQADTGPLIKQYFQRP